MYTGGGPSSTPSARAGWPLIGLLTVAMLTVALSTANAEEPSSSATGLVVASPQERLDEAWRRVDLRDFEGARLLLPSFETELPVEARYLLAVSYQLEPQHEPALAAFRALIEGWPTHPRAVDARFRVALTLADAERPDEALLALREVGRWQQLDGEAALKLRLSEATWTFESGKLGRGLRLITKALDEVSEGTLTWFQARARSAVLHHACTSANLLDFAVPEARVKARLNARATYVQAAEHELAELASLPEPFFILAGLLDLGDTFKDLGDDLLAAPPPTRLDAEQARIYQEGVRGRAETQYVKAHRYYDLAIEHIGRVHWQGPQLAVFEARIAEIDRLVEAR